MKKWAIVLALLLPGFISLWGQAPAGQEPDRKKSLELQLEINALNARISELESQLHKYRRALEKLGALAGKMDVICRDLPEA